MCEKTIEKLSHFPLKLPCKREVILRWQLTFQMGVWFWCSSLISPCLAVVLTRRPFHTATVFEVSPFSGLCNIFAGPGSMSSILSILWVITEFCIEYFLWREARSDGTNWTEIQSRSMSRNLYILGNHVPWIFLSCIFLPSLPPYSASFWLL